MTLLIIGLDPGTTTGCAILDDHGKLVNIFSGKELGLNEVIRRIISFGKPAIIATDKATIPHFVHEAATKLGAKLYSPKEDLLVKDKRILINEFERKHKTELEINTHEMDALASAISAYQKYKTLLDKAEDYLQKKQKYLLAEDFKLLIIRNENLPFDSALKMIEQQDQLILRDKKETLKLQDMREKERQMIRKELESKKISGLEFKIAHLESKISNLKNGISQRDKKITLLEKRIARQPKDKILAEKENKFHAQRAELEAYERRVKELEQEMKERDNFISKINEGILSKKIDDLGFKEFEKKKHLRINEDDILLVKNPIIRSEQVLNFLKDKVRVIITDNAPKKTDGFIYLRPKDLVLVENENFAILDKKKLSNALSEKTLLKEIVADYRKERKMD